MRKERQGEGKEGEMVVKWAQAGQNLLKYSLFSDNYKIKYRGMLLEFNDQKSYPKVRIVIKQN